VALPEAAGPVEASRDLDRGGWACRSLRSLRRAQGPRRAWLSLSKPLSVTVGTGPFDELRDLDPGGWACRSRWAWPWVPVPSTSSGTSTRVA